MDKKRMIGLCAAILMLLLAHGRAVAECVSERVCSWQYGRQVCTFQQRCFGYRAPACQYQNRCYPQRVCSYYFGVERCRFDNVCRPVQVCY